MIQLYVYIYICGNIINNNDERTHFFTKIYLSQFSKGLCVRSELETEQTATYWPQVPLTIAALLSHSAGLLNWRSLRAASHLSRSGSHCLELQLELQLQLTPTNWNRLWQWVIWLFEVHLLLVGVASALNSTRSQVKVISSTGCTYFLIDGSVEGQYVTSRTTKFIKTVQNCRCRQVILHNLSRSATRKFNITFSSEVEKCKKFSWSTCFCSSSWFQWIETKSSLAAPWEWDMK